IIKSVLVLVRELVDQRREICKRLPWVKPLLKEQFFVHCKFHTAPVASFALFVFSIAKTIQSKCIGRSLVCPYDEGKLNMDLELGFENQSDTVILLCKCLRQDISRRWITKEDKESE
ncbi:hypothetical protein HID58_034045, partial [Brassica napus]